MRERKGGEDAKLELTPMIDVVFQLLIFFVVTLQTPDILANLAISRPAAPETETTQNPELLTIVVGRDHWTLNGRLYSGSAGFAAMERNLQKLASFSRSLSIVLKCRPDAPHSALIRTLNACSREGLHNIAVFSL